MRAHREPRYTDTSGMVSGETITYYKSLQDRERNAPTQTGTIDQIYPNSVVTSDGVNVAAPLIETCISATGPRASERTYRPAIRRTFGVGRPISRL